MLLSPTTTKQLLALLTSRYSRTIMSTCSALHSRLLTMTWSPLQLHDHTTFDQPDTTDITSHLH